MFVRIGFTRLKTMCIIGTLPHERSQPQPLWISLAISTDLKFVSEEITTTIDYAALAELCQKVAQNHSYLLLETLAHEMMEQLFAQFSIARAKLTLEKPAALDAAQCAFVELERIRP